MIVYMYYDPSTPHGKRAFSSFRAACSDRASRFRRSERPEIYKVDLGKITMAKVCRILSGDGYAESMKDIA